MYHNYYFWPFVGKSLFYLFTIQDVILQRVISFPALMSYHLLSYACLLYSLGQLNPNPFKITTAHIFKSGSSKEHLLQAGCEPQSPNTRWGGREKPQAPTDKDSLPSRPLGSHTCREETPGGPSLRWPLCMQRNSGAVS